MAQPSIVYRNISEINCEIRRPFKTNFDCKLKKVSNGRKEYFIDNIWNVKVANIDTETAILLREPDKITVSMYNQTKGVECTIVMAQGGNQLICQDKSRLEGK